MGHRIFRRLLMATFGLMLFLQGASPAYSFLSVGKGDPLPLLSLTESSSGAKKEFSAEQGPLVLVFFGVDIDTKKERAIEVLSDIQQQRAFYRDRNIELAAVFVQPELVTVINDIVAQTHIDFPVYVDVGNQSFEKLGVYVMPSILIVNAEGTIYEGLGYTRNLDELLPGEIQVMLHEKSREALHAELQPEIVERTMAQRRARLDYNYAMNLVQRHNVEAALDKLDMALDKDPQFVPALVEKGCLLVQKKKLQEAATFLDHTLEIVPGLARALTCKDQLQAAVINQNQQEQEAAPAPPDPASWGFFADDEDEEESDK